MDQKANQPEWFCESSELSLEDQLWIWENVPLAEGDEIKLKNLETSGSVSVNGNDNGTYKREVNSGLNWNKPELISRLKHCTYKTPPNEVAALLEKLFELWPSNEGHWLWVAQRYTPRVISWAVSATEKEYLRGGIRKTPPAYFTYALRFRKKRKTFRDTNGTRKQQDL